MIQSRKDYLYYLACDKVALRMNRKRPRYKHDIIWTFERLLRKCEYYENCKHDFLSKISQVEVCKSKSSIRFLNRF